MAAPSFADENPIVQDFYTGLSPDERLAFAAYYVSVRNRHIKEVSRIRTSGGLTKLWNKRRNYWMRKVRPPEPPQQQNVPPPGPSREENAPRLYPLEVDTTKIGIDVAPALAEEEVTSPATSGEDEPMEYSDNGDIRIEPPRSMRRAIRQDLRRYWRFAKVINQPEGFMSNGIAGRGIYLFLLHNQEEVIIDRLVIKFVDGSVDAVKEEDQIERIRSEIEINELLAASSCSHVVQYRGKGPQSEPNKANPDRLYLYMGYAETGNFETFLDEYKIGACPLPEHYIWYTWKCLIQSLITLQTGRYCTDPLPVLDSDPSLPARKGDWRPIVHMDIKSSNIFIGDIDAGYQFYRRPLLADFDLAIKPDDYSAEALQKERNQGTEGWKPPEQITMNTNVADERSRIAGLVLTGQADIWAVGLFIWNMVHASMGNRWLTRKRTNLAISLENGHEIDFAEEYFDVPQHYHSSLPHLIRECLLFDPQERPTLAELEFRIAGNLRRLDNQYGDTINTRQGPEELRINYFKRESDFKVGADFQTSKRRKTNEDRSVTLDDQAEYTSLMGEPASSMDVDRAAQVEMLGAVRRKVARRLDVIPSMIGGGYQVDTVSIEKGYGELFERMLYLVEVDGTSPSHLTDLIAWEADHAPWKILPANLQKAMLVLLEDIVKNLLDEGSQEDSSFRNALQVMHHAVRWGILRLNLGYQPLQPEANWRFMRLHLAIRSITFLQAPTSG